MKNSIKLSQKTIDAIFNNAKEQSEYVIALFKVAFSSWDEIKFVM